MAQKLNPNRKPEPSEPYFQEPKSQSPILLQSPETLKLPTEELSEPKLEPLELFRASIVTEPHRTEATLVCKFPVPQPTLAEL